MTCKKHGEVEGVLDRQGSLFCPACLDQWATQRRLRIPEVTVRRPHSMGTKVDK